MSKDEPSLSDRANYISSQFAQSTPLQAYLQHLCGLPNRCKLGDSAVCTEEPETVAFHPAQKVDLMLGNFPVTQRSKRRLPGSTSSLSPGRAMQLRWETSPHLIQRFAILMSITPCNPQALPIRCRVDRGMEARSRKGL